MYKQSILFFAAMLASRLAFGAIDVMGFYSGNSTETLSGCLDPTDNGTFSGSLTLNIDDQAADFYQGSGQTEDGTFYSISGTVDDEGITSGSISYSEPDGTSGNGSFSGIFSGDNLSLSYNTTDLEGDTCTTVGSASLSRSSTSSDAEQALQQFAAAGTVTIISTLIQHQNLGLRQTKLRRKTADEIDVSGLNFNIGGELVSMGQLVSLLSGHQYSGSSTDHASLSNQPGFFATGTISIGERDETDSETGFDFSTGGLTAGADYAMTDNLFLGGALGYSRIDSEFDQSTGDLDVDGYSIAIYSTYNVPNGFYVDGILRFGWSDYEQDRKFILDGTLQTASASYDSHDYSVSLSTGLKLNSGPWNLEPFARIDYVEIEIDSFDEKAETAGADSSLLSIDEQSIRSLKSALGGQLSYSLSTQQAVYVPTLRFEWQHEFQDDSRTINSQFVSNPAVQTSFVTDNPDRDFFNMGAGVTAVFANGMMGFLYYEYLLGHSEISQHTINGGIRIEF
ncbi:MAG: autotransporter outer membrane beta-barrel domain-containing protein [Gammaproteobacteria bacterium]|nr:autotransporter outer membrane beta-barrel domain-containing protein [Gammaproteobacteria bacterium]